MVVSDSSALVNCLGWHSAPGIVGGIIREHTDSTSGRPRGKAVSNCAGLGAGTKIGESPRRENHTFFARCWGKRSHRAGSRDRGRIYHLDEKRARRLAKGVGLSVIGTLGVLMKAKEKGLVREVRPHMDALLANSFHISPFLYEKVLAQTGEL